MESNRNAAAEYLREGQRHQFAEPPDDLAAENAYQAARRAAPEWGEPYHWLGTVFEKQDKPKEAIEAYQQAIRLLSSDPRPLIALGRLRSNCGQYEEAIRLLEAGLAMKPHDAEADARLFLAEALERSGALEKAVAQWQIVGGMKPSYPSHHRPMEEAKRKLNEHGGQYPLLDDEKLVFAYLKHFETRDDELFWAWQHLHAYIRSEPQKAWEITLQLITAASERELAYVAAGPLEDLLYSRAELFVGEVERLARCDPKFLSALRMVSGPFTEESDASSRIQRAAGTPIRFIDDEWPSCNPKRESNDNE